MAADTAEERLMAMQVLASLEGISKRLGATHHRRDHRLLLLSWSL